MITDFDWNYLFLAPLAWLLAGLVADLMGKLRWYHRFIGLAVTVVSVCAILVLQRGTGATVSEYVAIAVASVVVPLIWTGGYAVYEALIDRTGR